MVSPPWTQAIAQNCGRLSMNQRCQRCAATLWATTHPATKASSRCALRSPLTIRCLDVHAGLELKMHTGHIAGMAELDGLLLMSGRLAPSLSPVSCGHCILHPCSDGGKVRSRITAM